MMKWLGGAIYLVDNVRLNYETTLSEIHGFIQELVSRFQMYKGILRLRHSKGMPWDTVVTL